MVEVARDLGRQVSFSFWSPLIINGPVFVRTSTVNEYVDIVALSLFNAGSPIMSLYDEGTSTTRNSMTQLVPLMLISNIMIPMELTLLPMKLINGIS